MACSSGADGHADVEIAKVMGAIGNHHETDGDPVSAVAAA
jgi:hypothetical protein